MTDVYTTPSWKCTLIETVSPSQTPTATQVLLVSPLNSGGHRVTGRLIPLPRATQLLGGGAGGG
jgi:hypothetical protein